MGRQKQIRRYFGFTFPGLMAFLGSRYNDHGHTVRDHVTNSLEAVTAVTIYPLFKILKIAIKILKIS